MIEEIISTRSIEIYFQAIVSIRTKDIYSFEALTRCNFKGENIPPDKLFHWAKKKKLNIKLDELIRKIAIEKFYKYYLQDKDLRLFLNIESELINNFGFDDETTEFLQIIENLGIPFKNFVLEIKEDKIKNVEALKSFCNTYRKLGFGIALDDFGTGSSNFHRIDLIRPDIIKIDKSLFKNIENNQINKEVIKAISKMSHNLGIRVLAEGVEDEEAINLGMKSFINLYQGYYFSKPVSNFTKKHKEEIFLKINEVGRSFKEKRIQAINSKREVINKYNSIANELIEKLDKLEVIYKILEKEFENYPDIEAIYLIDSNSSKQIYDTLIDYGVTEKFKPTNHGDEHYLKEYYYITLESKNGIYLSQKYISYASGNPCKTFAKKFESKNNSFILCFDIVLQKV